MVQSPKSARQALRSPLIRMFAFVDEREVCGCYVRKNTHPFETSVNHMEAMHVFQAVRNINQLSSTSVRQLCGWVTRGDVQAQIRFTYLFFWINSLMFLFPIHSETIANRCSLTVTPSNGSMFGWRRCFQATPSWQNLCNAFIHTGAMVQVEDSP
jgi:hypothetical protein